VSDRYANFCN